MNQPENTVLLEAARDGEKPIIILIDGYEHKDWEMTLAGWVLVNNVTSWATRVEAVFSDGERFAYGGSK